MVGNILAATTGTAILGTDLSGSIEFFNVGAERLSGYTTTEVVGVAHVGLAPDHGRFTLAVSRTRWPGDQPLTDLLEPYLLRSSGPVTADWNFVRRDGDLRTIAVTLSRRHGVEGEALGYLVVAEDVTDRRLNELW